MFKKIAFILSIALTLHANSRAQKLTLDWGPETEEIKRTHVVSILGMANDKYYVHRAKDNGKGLRQ